MAWVTRLCGKRVFFISPYLTLPILASRALEKIKVAIAIAVRVIGSTVVILTVEPVVIPALELV